MRAPLAALGARLPPPEIVRKTKTFDWIGLRLAAAWHIRSAPFDSLTQPYYRRRVIRFGFSDATHAYSRPGSRRVSRGSQAPPSVHLGCLHVATKAAGSVIEAPATAAANGTGGAERALEYTVDRFADRLVSELGLRG
jgi:hypothetical protein